MKPEYKCCLVRMEDGTVRAMYLKPEFANVRLSLIVRIKGKQQRVDVLEILE